VVNNESRLLPSLIHTRAEGRPREIFGHLLCHERALRFTPVALEGERSFACHCNENFLDACIFGSRFSGGCASTIIPISNNNNIHPENRLLYVQSKIFGTFSRETGWVCFSVPCFNWAGMIPSAGSFEMIKFLGSSNKERRKKSTLFHLMRSMRKGRSG
jgi:hypothetical protein